MQDVDHLVYAAADLRSGMDAIEALLGVRPVPGGRHPAYGTHNALLGLGPSTYLEVLAPDPALPRPARGVLLEEAARTGPRLARWVARTEAIAAAAAALRTAGFEPGAVEDGRRERPDGTVLAWRLTDPRVLPLEGAVPFLIDWGETPHPAGSLPAAGRLVAFRIEHPHPERVRAALAALGMTLSVRAADRPGLVATVETASGRVELR